MISTVPGSAARRRATGEERFAAEAELARAARALGDLVDDRIDGGPSGGLRLMGIGLPGNARGLEEIDRRTRRSVWTVCRHGFYDPRGPGRVRNERFRRRGVDLQLRIPARAVRRYPLTASLSPPDKIRISLPVSRHFAIYDSELLKILGPLTVHGDYTKWTSTDPLLLRYARRVQRLIDALSTPLAPSQGVVLSERQLDIAESLCRGLKDATIARNHGVSTRTLERETATILRALGARSRAEGIAIMLGHGPPTPPPG
ncbi:MAG: LuxR C-terminal-related transcriptional regulator [Angustibacter sp.]